MGVRQALFRQLPVERLQRQAEQQRDFRRVLGLWQLTAIGLGGIIGVGIFVLAGQQAAINAGPAVAISFLIAGFGSACAALCYAEFSGMIPVTGSAYTYSYAVLGELAAWIIGWDLLLEYALIVGVVAIGWSGYVQALLGAAGIVLPVWARGADGTGEGHVFDLIAALITLAISLLLCARSEYGARFNGAMVAIKIAGALLVIVAGVAHIDPVNWQPFVPPRVVDAEGVGHFGWSGVLAAASVVFFAVFGYDTLTTAAEESRQPQRDLPRAVLLSLGISMALYLAIALVLTGMVPYSTLNTAAPVADAFAAVGDRWVMIAISVAAVAGLTSVMFAFMLGTSRIAFALARDGLLPGFLARIHPRFGTPTRPTLILGSCTAVLAGSLPIGEVAELVNIGTLGAFILICTAVLVLRVQRPEIPRAFRTPAVWLFAPLGIAFSAVLIAGLPWITVERFAIWMAIGLLLYFAYGIRHSVLARESR